MTCAKCGAELSVLEKDLTRNDGMPDHDVPFWYCPACKEYKAMFVEGVEE